MPSDYKTDASPRSAYTTKIISREGIEPTIYAYEAKVLTK